MYNRYIPQPDGSYSRRRMQEPRRQEPAPHPTPHPHPVQPTPCPEPPLEPCPQPRREPCPQPPKKPPSCQSESIPGFLRQLLPKGLDTGDLFVLLLLLLMAGDCNEDRNTAMLTLALYLFM